MSLIKVLVIRCDGTEETHKINANNFHAEVEPLIGAKTFGTVNIFKNPIHAPRFGMRRPVMVLDDAGYDTRVIQHGNHEHHVPIQARRPVNPKATELYHSVCRPGTTHEIVGDVAIVDDEDLA
jgi:hypothetical protein